MIYLFKNQKEIYDEYPVVDTKDVTVFNRTHEINGEDSIIIEMPVKIDDAKINEHLNNIHYIAFKDKKSTHVGLLANKKDKFQMYRLTNVSIQDDIITFEGVHKFLDDAKAGAIIRDRRFKEYEARNVAPAAFEPINWKMYDSDTTPPKSLNFYYISPLEALQKIVNAYGVEIDYWVEFDGYKITGQYYKIKNEVGEQRNKLYDYGSNVLDIKAEQDWSEIYTAVIGRGRGEQVSEADEENGQQGDGYGRKIKFDEVVWSVDNKDPLDKPKGEDTLVHPQATELYGYVEDNKIKPRVAVVDFSNEEDPEELLKLSYEWLLQAIVPKAVFSLNIPDGDGLNLGDKVAVTYHDIGVAKWTRVTKIIDDMLSERRHVEFGDVSHFRNNSARAQMENDIEELKAENDSYSERIYELKKEFDSDFEQQWQNAENSFVEELNKVKAEIEAMEHRFDAKFERELSEFNTKFQDLLDRANQLTKEEVERITRELRDDFDRIQNEMGDRLGEFEKEDENIWNKLDEIIDEIPTLTEDEKHADGLKKEIADLRSEIEDINARPEREREEVRDEISEEEQRLEDLRAEIEQIIDERNRDYRLELSRKEQDLSDLEDKIAKRIEDDKDDLQQQIKAKKKEIQALKNAYAKRVEYDSQLLAEYRSQLTDFVQQINAHRNNHVDELRAEQSDKRKQAKALEEYVEEIKEHARRPIRTEIEQLENEIERVQEERIEVRQHFEDVKNAVVEKLENDKKNVNSKLSDVLLELDKVDDNYSKKLKKVNEFVRYNPYIEEQINDISQAFIDKFDEKFKAQEDFINNLDTDEMTRDYITYYDEIFKNSESYYYYYYYDVVSENGYDTTLLDDYADMLPKPKFETTEALDDWFFGKYSEDKLDNVDEDTFTQTLSLLYELIEVYANPTEEVVNIISGYTTPKHEIVTRLESDMQAEKKTLEEDLQRLESEFKYVNKRISEVRKGNLIVDDLIGVDVDGMNLLIGTDECVTDNNQVDLKDKNRHLKDVLKSNTEYSMSLDAEIKNSINVLTQVNLFSTGFDYFGTSRQFAYVRSPDRKLDEDFKGRLSSRFKTKNFDLNLDKFFSLRFGNASTTLIGEHQQFCRPKLELGSTATPWKPHPTEIEAYLEKLDEQVKELSEKISELSAQLEEDIDITDVEFSGRNLILNSGTPYNHGNYLIANYTLSKPMEIGETYTLTVKGNVQNNNSSYSGLAILRDFGKYFISSNTPKIDEDVYQITFVANSDTFNTDNIRLYNYPNATRVNANIEWIRLEKGTIATDWTPAPEDIPDLLNQLNEDIDNLEDRINELLSWQLVDHKDYTDAIKLNNREKYIVDTSEFEEINQKISELLKYLDSMTPDEQSQLEALNNQLQALEKQLADVSITSDEQRQIDDLKAEIERLKRLIESRPLNEDEVNSINALQENIKVLTARLSGISNQLTKEEQSRLSDINGSVANLTNELVEVEKRYNPLIEDLQSVIEQVGVIEKTQNSEIAKLHSVEQDLHGMTRRIAQAETTMDSEILKTNKLSQTIDNTVSRLTSMERTQTTETERISQVKHDLAGLSGQFSDLVTDINHPNDPVLRQLDIEAGIDGFYVRNKKVMDGQTMAGYIMATENTVSNGVRDALTDNDVTINNAGVKIGSKQLTGSQMASSIVVSPQAIDLISRNINIDGNLNVLGKIQAESAKIAKAEIADAYISKLTANTVDTIHLKSEAVTATKLKVDNALANKLIANYVLSNHIETKSIEAVNGRFGSLFAQYIRTTVIEADQLRSSTALFDKVFASDAYIRRLTSQTAFIRDIQAIDITASRITSINGNNNTRIIGGYLESSGTYRRTWLGRTSTNQVDIRIENGYIRARNNSRNWSLYFSDFGISTYNDAVGDDDSSGSLIFRDTTYSTARSLMAHSTYGVVALQSEENAIVLAPMRSSRSGNNIFRFAVKKNPSSSDTDGWIAYGSPNLNYATGIRFKKSTAGQPTLWVTNGNGDKGTGDIVVRTWTAVSHEKYKRDINKWTKNILDVYKNELQLYKYKYLDRYGTHYDLYQHGIILRENESNDQFPAEWRHEDGFNGNEVIFWNAKAIQELAFENDKLKSEIKDLNTKINKLMEMVS